MEFDDVFDMVLALIDDYHLGFDGNGMPCVTQPNNPHYEDNLTYLRMKMQVLINMVIVKAQIPDLTFDKDFECFNRDLSVLEASILTYGLLVTWLSPFINNREVLQTQLTSKEVTTFSNANRIQQGIQLYKLAKTEFYQLCIDYSTIQIAAQIKAQLEENK